MNAELMEKYREVIRQRLEEGRKDDVEAEWKRLQVVVYVMCGGGFLGRSAAEQPADFYIDSRCGRLPYKNRDILQAVAALAMIAEELGYDPHFLPVMGHFHSCGIF